jgi:DNA-binding MarR family transcriptional regulator/GNAT superfamily N-acetyltransferase
VAAVREFSRFYTDALGLLGGGLLATPYSLTEARVLFELGQSESTGTRELRQRLGLDPGYLSRIVTRFESGGLVARTRSTADARRQVLRLTARGREAALDLDARSTAQVAGLLDGADAPQRTALVDALGTVRTILSRPADRLPVTLRPLRPGDLGWVLQRHGALYAQEYGWDVTFEGLVAQIVADYARSSAAAGHATDGHAADGHAAWIAELGGRPAGSVFCTRAADDVAQLRLLLVEPSARGAGVGTALVDECVRFAAGAGYREIMLWTNDVLVAARRIYERAGFRLDHEGGKPTFGADLTEQIWRRALP